MTVRFALRNVGTRPASKLRISFETQGEVFLIRRSGEADEEDDQPMIQPAVTQLPKPPVAPKAERVVKRPPKPQPARSTDIARLGLTVPGSMLEAAALTESVLGDFRRTGVFDEMTCGSSAIQQALALQKEHERFQNLLSPPHLNMLTRSDHRAFADTIIHRPPVFPKFPELPKHDPENFYYDDWPKERPVKTGALTCDLFRHQGEAEIFDVEVLFPKEGDVTGAVRCRVQAENLTKPIERRIQVSRTVEHFDLLNVAEGLIEALGT